MQSMYSQSEVVMGGDAYIHKCVYPSFLLSSGEAVYSCMFLQGYYLIGSWIYNLVGRYEFPSFHAVLQ